MPLPRLSSRRRPDGVVPIGSMSRQVSWEELSQEIWARVSVHGENADITVPYIPGVKSKMHLTYAGTRFQIERVTSLGSDEQIRLYCTATN